MEEEGRGRERKGGGNGNVKIRAGLGGLGWAGYKRRDALVYYRELIHSRGRSRSYDDTTFSRRWGYYG
jgi:hypothetical protein